MIDHAEAAFVRNYIHKNKRDRLLLELSDEKRRARAVDRFSHTAEELILLEKAVLYGTQLSIAQMVLALEAASSTGECHAILSDGSTLDAPIVETVTAVYGSGPAIVIAESAVYIETEPWTPTMRYVLSCKTE